MLFINTEMICTNYLGTAMTISDEGCKISPDERVCIEAALHNFANWTAYDKRENTEMPLVRLHN